MFSQKASTASTSPAAARDCGYEGLAVGGKFPRQRVQAEKCLFNRHREFLPQVARYFEQAPLSREFKPVAGLDLDGGNPLRHDLPGANGRGGTQFLVRRLAGCLHGRLNTAAGARNVLVRNAAKPLLELLHSMTAIHQVGVAIDQSRRQPQTLGLVNANAGRLSLAQTLGGRADPRNTITFHRQGAVFDIAIGFGARDHGGNVGPGPNLVPVLAR
jgi:hypothetical protein